MVKREWWRGTPCADSKYSIVRLFIREMSLFSSVAFMNLIFLFLDGLWESLFEGRIEEMKICIDSMECV